MEDHKLECHQYTLGQESMRASEMSLTNIGPAMAGSLQLYVPRPKKVTEILKPSTGMSGSLLWTSTARKVDGGYTSDWSEWVSNEMPQWFSDKGILFKVSGGAKILSMNTDKDAFKIGEYYGYPKPTSPMGWFSWAHNFPWDKVENDFDAVHHYPSGSRTANILMNTWDVESTVWFNTKHLKKLGEVSISHES